MFRLIVATSVVAILSAIPSCTGEPDEPRYDARACDEFVVPQSFGLGWEDINHRVSLFSIRLDQGQCQAQRLNVGHIGGDFSTGEMFTDVPYVDFAYQRVRTDRRQIGAGRLTIAQRIGPEGQATGTKTFSREELNLREYPVVVPVIEGLRFDTRVAQSDDYPSSYDPAHGYTMRALGARLDVASIDEESITIEYAIRFEPGASADRYNHNQALAHAEVEAELDVLMLGVDQRQAMRGRVEYTLEYPQPEPLVDQVFEPAPRETRTVEVEGVPGAPAGVYGLNGFEFVLDLDTSCDADSDCPNGDRCDADGQCALEVGEPGEYMREFRFGVEQTAYDEETGTGRFVFDGFASNASKFLAFYALKYTFTGEVTWVQAGEAEARQTLQQTFDTGETSFELED